LESRSVNLLHLSGVALLCGGGVCVGLLGWGCGMVCVSGSAVVGGC
jgi:hypothetical protein